MLGVKREVDCDTSETSSYHSDHSHHMDDGEDRPPIPPKRQKKQPKPEQENNHNSDGDEGTSTYNKFKTHNEVEIGEAYKTGPIRLQLDELDEIVAFGHIVQYIQQGCGMVLVNPSNPS